MHPLDSRASRLPLTQPAGHLVSPLASNHSVVSAGSELEQLMATMAVLPHQPAAMSLGGGPNEPLQLASLVQLLLHCRAVLEHA